MFVSSAPRTLIILNGVCGVRKVVPYTNGLATTSGTFIGIARFDCSLDSKTGRNPTPSRCGSLPALGISSALVEADGARLSRSTEELFLGLMLVTFAQTAVFCG